MAFINIPNRHQVGRRAIANKVRLLKGSHGNNSVPMLVASDVAAASGIVPGSYVAIMVGTGDDAGSLLVRPASSGFKFRASKAKHGSPIVELPKRIFSDAPKMAMTVRHEITPEGLVVHLGRLLIGSDQPAATNGIAATYEARAA